MNSTHRRRMRRLSILPRRTRPDNDYQGKVNSSETGSTAKWSPPQMLDFKIDWSRRTPLLPGEHRWPDSVPRLYGSCGLSPENRHYSYAVE